MSVFRSESAQGDLPAMHELAIVAEDIIRSHAELDRTTQQLRELCVALAREDSPVRREPSELVAEFRIQLLAHFREEESDDSFGYVATDRPHFLGKIERLQTEHGEMESALEDILESAKSGPRGGELGARIGRFLDTLAAHEHAENQLMQDLLTHDEGGGG
jgi:hypothetical protein